MDLSYVGMALELKSVNVAQRVISGYAAAHHNLDRVRDIVDHGGSEKAVRRLNGKTGDVGVFIAHNQMALPIGIPQRIEATPRGLYTETYILKGHEGDNLLAVAKDLLDHGQSLGMSIGYKTRDSRMEQTAHGRARRILDYDLKEYSYLAAQSAANPDALVQAVKGLRRPAAGRGKGLTEGSDTAGGAAVPTQTPRGKAGRMNYRVEQRGEQWAVLCDADSDGDEDDNEIIGTYGSEETANAVVIALRGRQGSDTDDDAPSGTDEMDADGQMSMVGDKRAGPPAEQKAVWTGKDVDSLPDSSFLFVESGGTKDGDGKTVPRSKRHFPVKDADGKVDLPHLRNAIARIPQSDAPGVDKATLQARARRMLATADGSKSYEEPLEWQSGSAPTIAGMGYALLDIAESIAQEHKAMSLLGEETKGNQRIRKNLRDQLTATRDDLNRVITWAETIDRGEDSAARLAWHRQQLALATF